jgi:hypothetical protein
MMITYVQQQRKKIGLLTFPIIKVITATEFMNAISKF